MLKQCSHRWGTDEHGWGARRCIRVRPCPGRCYASFMSTRLLTDDALLAECRWDIYRGSGPGGQKRNKTSNTVRLTHLPTGTQVTAGESRSQAENRMRALRRL